MRNYIGVQFEFSKAMYDRNLQDELAKESTENINHTLRQRIASLEYNVHLLQYRERMLRSNCIGQDKAIKRLKHKLRELAPKPSWEASTKCAAGTVTAACK